MFGFFKKKEPRERLELRKEFEKVTMAVHSADSPVQIAVGYGINLANSVFVKRYSTVDTFVNLPREERTAYIVSLTQFEEKLCKQDPPAAVGVGLFKMWIGVVAERDDELASQFSKEISYFSRKAP